MALGDADLFDHAPNLKSQMLVYQLDVSSDLGDGFGLGIQGTFLGTLGLDEECPLVELWQQLVRIK